MNLWDDPIAAGRAVDDPATPGAELAQIAVQYPALQAAIVWHPKVNSGLLSWLTEKGDAQVARIARVRLGARSLSTDQSAVRSLLMDQPWSQPSEVAAKTNESMQSSDKSGPDPSVPDDLANPPGRQLAEPAKTEPPAPVVRPGIDLTPPAFLVATRPDPNKSSAELAQPPKHPKPAAASAPEGEGAALAAYGPAPANPVSLVATSTQEAQGQGVRLLSLRPPEGGRIAAARVPESAVPQLTVLHPEASSGAGWPGTSKKRWWSRKRPKTLEPPSAPGQTGEANPMAVHPPERTSASPTAPVAKKPAQVPENTKQPVLPAPGPVEALATESSALATQAQVEANPNQVAAPAQPPALLDQASPAAGPMPIVTKADAGQSLGPTTTASALTSAPTVPVAVVPLPTGASSGPQPAPIAAPPQPTKKRPLSTRAALMVAFAAVLITFCLIVGLLMVTGLVHGGHGETESIGQLTNGLVAFLPGG